ncbi:hypothetical protein COCOBI_01-8130 [Coccomyxa sp. Obi]|nr:hypothetical protein COCOBI_01-8130 [Coccomyxa sp. Obi]
MRYSTATGEVGTGRPTGRGCGAVAGCWCTGGIRSNRCAPLNGPRDLSILQATSVIEKSKLRCFNLKKVEGALDEVTSERQAYERRIAARDARMDYAVAEMKKIWKTRNQKETVLLEDADPEETWCATDVKFYAIFLALESGATLEHPWMKKLFEVSEKRMDPRELLKIYREDPGSLVANLYDPGRYRMTPEAESTEPLESMSTCAAMRALVGKDNWRESPALQAWLLKAREVVQSTSQGTAVGEKGRHRCFDMKSLEIALHEVTSEIQSHDCKEEAQAKHLNNAKAVEGQEKSKRIQKLKALREEMRCRTDLKIYAIYLLVESGASLEQPWVKQLIDVSYKRLDPRELLKIYREDPGSLKITDMNDPGRYWIPPETLKHRGCHPCNTCGAMRALVGRDNWKESPKFKAFWEKSVQALKSKQGVQPALQGGSNDMSHQGSTDAMET